MSIPIYELIKKAMVNGEIPRDFSLFIKEDEVLFADGAKDGISYYHFGTSEVSDEDYNTMSKAISEASDRNFEQANKLFIELSKNVSCLSIIDKLQKHIWDNKENLQARNLYDYAVETITLSDNIECIKYGLSILEMLNTNNEELKKDIKILALCDEFTFYCVNIMKTWPQGNVDIFETAKKVYGWGRIFAVEQLRALDPYYEEIRKWMLEEGIHNDVSSAYSALTVWRNGNVGSTLYTHPTFEQFHYIRDIIDALLDEEPVQGLSALDKRKEIILTFLNEALKMPLVLEDYIVIHNIYSYFKDLDDCQEILSLAKKILSEDKAKNIILDGIKKGKAIDLGIFIGIDCKPYILELMKNNFKDSYYLCRYLVDDDNYRKELLRVFENNLSLKEIVSVPDNSLGFENKHFNQAALGCLMQELRRYPLEGIEFIKAGLQSKPVRTRNSALAVLKSWTNILNKPLSEISPELHVLLIMTSALETDDGIRNKMEKLISADVSSEDNKTSDNNTLNMLSDAISDVGSWRWWYVDDDIVQLEFQDVQLYDYSTNEKETHSSIIALSFKDKSFALFLDNLDDQNKGWYKQLQNDEIEPFSLDGYELNFNDAQFVNEIIETYKNKITVKDITDEAIVTSKYIMAGKCGEVAFVVGGDRLEVLNHQGKINMEDIEKAYQDWWKYWKDYWRLRKTKEAYEKDFACEVTIPIRS